jgi:hypothetical protein
MDAWSKWQRRKTEVRVRASSPNAMYGYCRVPSCGKPARAGTSDGLDTRYCRSHADHLQRHGSLYKRSFPASVLNPYRRAALAWVEENSDNFWVQNAVERVKGLYTTVGRHEEAFRLRGMKPNERAGVHWARLRKAEVNPYLVIAVWLAIEIAVKDDRQPVTASEFKRVQAAKIVHRMASGTHRRWEQEVPDSKSGKTKTRVTEMHVYPRSRGRILRHIGKDLETAVELLVDHHLHDVHAFKNRRDRRGSFRDRPYPKGTVSRKRRQVN